MTSIFNSLYGWDVFLIKFDGEKWVLREIVVMDSGQSEAEILGTFDSLQSVRDFLSIVSTKTLPDKFRIISQVME